MSDVKRLLAEAAVETPLGNWWTNGLAVFDNIDQPVADIEDSPANAALIVYAVNHLPDYEAAVEAVTAFLKRWDNPEVYHRLPAVDDLRAVLARLRESVPA